MLNAFTGNGAIAHEHTKNHLLEYFSKGGSIKQKGQTYYNNIVEDQLDLFKKAWYTGQEEVCMQLAFWTRDCRGGAGARQNFRDIIKWLAQNSPEWIMTNIDLIPKYGRWDDLKVLYGTPCENTALAFWGDALTSDDPDVTPLASKWCDRQDYRLRNYLGMSPKAFRKMVSKNSGDIVEKKMCSGTWEDINFNHVPSVAMARYRNAFKKHAEPEYNKWMSDLIAGKAKINARVLFPHDVIRTAKNSLGPDDDIDMFTDFIDTVFDNLPDYIEDPNVRIMPICDFSASMNVAVSGSVTAFDVALGLGLYCSDRLGVDNPFYRKLIPFSSTAKLESWKDMSVFDAIGKIPNGYIGSTNIQAALDNLLEAAKFFNVSKDQMVNTILILSDMQFDPHKPDTGTYMYSSSPIAGYNETVVEKCMSQWEKAGYDKPKIIYWNLHNYGNSPSTKDEKNIALVSGFSPSILKHVLSKGDINPLDVMLSAIEKYKVKIP